MDYDPDGLIELQAAIDRLAIRDFQRRYLCVKYPPADRYLQARGYTLTADGAITYGKIRLEPGEPISKRRGWAA